MKIYVKLTCVVLACITLLSCISVLGVSADTYIIDGDYKISRENAGIMVHGYTGEDTILTVPDTFLGQTTVSIAQYAFMNTNIVSVSLPISIIDVNRGAFFGCTSLVSATLPRNCATIGQYLFYGCTSLVEVSLPDVLTEVPRYCFTRCESLETVSLPSTAKVIGEYAFANCSELKDVYVSRYTTSISETAFENSPQVVIHGYLDTYAYEYAMEMGIPFSPINPPAETYYVTFLNYDGSVFRTTPVTKGGTVKYPVDIPTKPSTETHYYEFSHWNGNIANVQEHEFLTPVFKEFRIKSEEELENLFYSVVFLDGDGMFLEMQTVKEKEGAVAPDVVPEKTPTVQYCYTFTGWDTDFSDVRENMVVRPVFEEQLREYTVTFTGMNGDEVLSVQTVTYGEAAQAPEAPEVEGYEFDSWSADFSCIASDLVVKALYTEVEQPPEATEPEKAQYIVVFIGFDSRYLGSQLVTEGEAAVAPEAPYVEGFVFSGWNKKFDSVTSDLTVNALYMKDPNAEEKPDVEIQESHTVTFLGLNNSFIEVQIVKNGEGAQAPEPPAVAGYEFIDWDKYFEYVYEDMVVTAVYRKIQQPPSDTPKTGILKIDIAGGSGFSIGIGNGFAKPQGASYRNSAIPVGEEVRVTASSISGEAFIGWVNPVTGMLLSTKTNYTFVTSGNDSLTAIYAAPIGGFNMVTFVNDKSGTNGRILDMQYYSTMDEIVFPDAPTQVGFEFAGWSMTIEEIMEAIGNGTDVTVTAKWTKVEVPVEVVVWGGSGSGTYNANYRVTVVADEASGDEKFAYWTDADGNIKSYSQEYHFYPTKDTTLYAVYVHIEDEIDYQVLVSVDAIDTETVADKNVFTYSWYCPETYEFVKAGIVAVNEDNYSEDTFTAGSDDNNVYDRSPSGADLKPVNTYTWTKSNVTSGQTWVAKAYVQYKDAEGQLVTVYSDTVTATKE